MVSRGQMRLWAHFTVDELREAWPEWLDLSRKLVAESTAGFKGPGLPATQR